MRRQLALLAALACGDTDRGPPVEPEPPPMLPDEAWVRESRARNGLTELYVREVGPALARETVLVVHGGPGHSHDYLRPLEVGAAGDLRIVFYDQRGIGRSTGPMDTAKTHWDFAAYRGDLEAVLDHTGTEKAHLIGFSWGGILSMNFAIHRPERVASLALVASGWARAATPDDWTRVNARRSELMKAGVMTRQPAEFEDCVDRSRYIKPLYFADPQHPAVQRESGAVCSNQITRATWNAVGDFDLRPELPKITAPALVFHGAQDFVVPPEIARATHEALGAHARLVVEDSCGHRVVDECRPALFGALEQLWNAPGLPKRAEESVPEPDPAAFAERRRAAKERDAAMLNAETGAAIRRDAGLESEG